MLGLRSAAARVAGPRGREVLEQLQEGVAVGPGAQLPPNGAAVRAHRKVVGPQALCCPPPHSLPLLPPCRSLHRPPQLPPTPALCPWGVAHPIPPHPLSLQA